MVHLHGRNNFYRSTDVLLMCLFHIVSMHHNTIPCFTNTCLVLRADLRLIPVSDGRPVDEAEADKGSSQRSSSGGLENPAFVET